MAGFHKKRRIVGPSKNELKLQRGEAEERRARSAGTIAQRFPQVERLTITLSFLSPQSAPLGDEKRVFKTSDAPDFSAPCPGRCGGGKFDLEGKVSAVLDARQPVAEATGVCQQPLYAGSPDVCGARLQCKIEATYLPEPKEEPAAA